MADKTSIQWTDASWNPVRAVTKELPNLKGWHCEHVSEGCRNCYAESMNRRLGTRLDFKPGERKNIDIFVDYKLLQLPLKWKKPRQIFVGSMTDMFADFVTDAMLDEVFGIVAQAPQHTFQFLTKRAARMRRYNALGKGNSSLRNVHFGVSVEDQDAADERIPDLVHTNCGAHFLSVEPMLGRINLTKYLPYLDWVICGGESGPGAREFRYSWASDLAQQCADDRCSFFMKQVGAEPVDDMDYGGGAHNVKLRDAKGGDPSEWPDILRVREFPK